MIQNFTNNKLTNINIHIMTKEELRLQKEYKKLLKVHEEANRTAKHAKQRIAQIRRQVNIVDIIVDEREDEILLKTM